VMSTMTLVLKFVGNVAKIEVRIAGKIMLYRLSFFLWDKSKPLCC
jgi:hypothetical protein